MIQKIVNALRGIGVDHPVVGAVRGVLELGTYAFIGASFIALGGLDWEALGVPVWIPLASVLPVVRRTLEGVADKIDPKTPRNPNT
jgi:hypothetical protein